MYTWEFQHDWEFNVKQIIERLSGSTKATAGRIGSLSISNDVSFNRN